MARREPAPLIAYQRVLETRDELAQPFVIVGGQAVNFWSNRYAAQEPHFAAFEPFASKDLDLLIADSQVGRLAEEVAPQGWTFVPPDPDAGTVLGRLEHDQLLVELMAPGLHRPIFAARSVELPVGNRTLPIRVSHPLLLLDSKIDLALRISQDGSVAGIEVRRDAEHVRMLSLLIPHFLTEQVQGHDTLAGRSSILQPMVAVLASIRRGTGDRFDAAYPGVVVQSGWPSLRLRKRRNCEWREVEGGSGQAAWTRTDRRKPIITDGDQTQTVLPTRS